MTPKIDAGRDPLESERSFRLLVEGVVDYAIYLLSPQGIVTSWNAGAERIKGYAAAEIIGQHFSVFYPPEDRELGMPARSLDFARRTGKFEAEGWRIRRDGTRFLASVVIDAIYEDGDLIGFAKITRDITERKKVEAALAESELNFRRLVAGVSDYALYMLDPEGRITSWNAGGQRIKGYLPDEIIGQHFSKFYTDVDQAAGKPARALEIARTTGRYEDEAWRVRKDGTFFWASVVIDPIRESGKLIGFAKITRDVTERREAQLTLEKIQHQLAESQKLDALGQLTGGVAHDFNNLLMIISGNIHALKRVVGEDAKAKRAIQAIETAATRSAALTSQLLTFARRQRVNPETVNITERIAAVREVLETGLGGAVGLALEIEPGVWPVMVDVTEFETALVNLAVNARDAMPDGGVVTIRLRNTQIDDCDYVALTVEDEGLGIPQDVMERVFDPFFTTKPVGKGTGLGLSQVHGFAHQAGGVVELKSKLGEGTQVTICLPRSVGSVEEAGRGATVVGSGTVLLVEDNPDVAEASAGLLEQLGYSVRLASNAEAALEEIDRAGIDLVFSDIVMPGKMDGIELAQALKKKHPALPILLATGYSANTDRAGLDFPVLRKPYQIHELSQALTKVLAR